MQGFQKEEATYDAPSALNVNNNIVSGHWFQRTSAWTMRNAMKNTTSTLSSYKKASDNGSQKKIVHKKGSVCGGGRELFTAPRSRILAASASTGAEILIT